VCVVCVCVCVGTCRVAAGAINSNLMGTALVVNELKREKNELEEKLTKTMQALFVMQV